MAEQEGVIKYRLDYRPTRPCYYPECAELNAWRTILYRLGLIGQCSERYDGLAYGNISFRLKNQRQFVITGSQTGGLSQLTCDHYSKILDADLDKNHIIAEGALKPSSEALTHAAVYQANPGMRAVVHIHSPLIWRCHQKLALPVIEPGIQYGTQAMAAAVTNLLNQNVPSNKRLFVMLGHEDGIVAFGDSIAEGSQIVIRTLAAAMQMTGERSS